MKIYLASSWRNARQPAALAALREAGHEVYDFRNPAPGDSGFGWRQCDPRPPAEWSVADYLKVLDHPVAKRGFKFDMDALRGCDACVLVLPCGRSAHLELGWAAGAGKRTIVLCEKLDEPELMYLMCERVAASVEEVIAALAAPSVVAAQAPAAQPEAGSAAAEMEAAEATFDDEQAAHQETLAELATLRARLAEVDRDADMLVRGHCDALTKADAEKARADAAESRLAKTEAALALANEAYEDLRRTNHQIGEQRHATEARVAELERVLAIRTALLEEATAPAAKEEPARVELNQTKTWPGGDDPYSDKHCCHCGRETAPGAARIRTVRTNDGNWWVAPDRPLAADESHFEFVFLPIGPSCLEKNPQYRIGLAAPPAQVQAEALGECNCPDAIPGVTDEPCPVHGGKSRRPAPAKEGA